MWRSAPTGTGWPPPATTRRCGLWDADTGQPVGHPLTGTPTSDQCGVQPRRAPAGHRQRRQDGAAVGRRHRPAPRRTPDRPRPARYTMWRSAPTGTGSPPPAPTTRCGCGTPTPANPIGEPLTGHTDRYPVWRSAPTGTGWPPPAPTARCGCGTPTPANRSASPLTRPHGRGLERGVQPGRTPAGQRQRRQRRCGCGTPTPANRSANR